MKDALSTPNLKPKPKPKPVESAELARLRERVERLEAWVFRTEDRKKVEERYYESIAGQVFR